MGMPGGLTERELERAIAEMARFLGYLVFHARPAQTSKGWRTAVAYDGKGFPDLTLVKAGRVIFAEIKTDSGRLSPDQIKWREAIHQGESEWYLWTPREWMAGEVEMVLAASPTRMKGLRPA